MSAIYDIFINLIGFIWDIGKMLVPIMIVIEIFKDTKLIDKIANAFYPVSKFFTLSKNAGVSLLFGMFFGLTIGAGAIIQSVKDYNVDKRSVFLVSMFISPCHAVFEDALIMAAAGASVLHLVPARFISGIIATYVLSRLIKKETDDVLTIDEN